MKAVICNRLENSVQYLNNIADDPNKNALKKIKTILKSFN